MRRPRTLMSHSLDGFPARQFSATMAFGGEAQTPDGPAVVNDHVTYAASAFAREILDARIQWHRRRASRVGGAAASGAFGASVAVSVAAL
jgi:hypothetical protein